MLPASPPILPLQPMRMRSPISSRPCANAPVWKPAAAARVQQGVAASPGLAVGRIVRHETKALVVEDRSAGAMEEGNALEVALGKVAAELTEMEAETRRRLGAGEAAIFAAQRELVSDPLLLRSANGDIMRGHGAARAWKKALDARVDQQRQLPDPLLQAPDAGPGEGGHAICRPAHAPAASNSGSSPPSRWQA